MAQRVWLHIGLPKTGTSYLQDILWQNKETLKEQGLLLPGSRRHHFRATNQVRGKRSSSINAGATEAAFERLTKLVHDQAGDVLISHELFSQATAQQARFAIESFGGADTRVVITARDLGRQVPAAWQQQVRQGSKKRLEAFLHDLVHGEGRQTKAFWSFQDLPAVAARWGADLPAEHVHVVVVPPEGKDQGELWARFASVLGVDPDSVTSDTAGRNESIGYVQAELLRRINARGRPAFEQTGDQILFSKLLTNKVLTRSPTKQPITIDDETYAWLRRKALEMVTIVQQRKYAVVGDLEELIPPERSEPAAPSHATDEALLRAAIDAILGLLDLSRKRS